MKKKTLKERWKAAPPALKILIPAAILLLAGAAGFAGYQFSALPVEYTEVVQEHVEDWYLENGTLKLGEDYMQISQVSGDLSQVCVSENQPVSKGELMFVIDPRDYVYQRDLTQAELSGLRAQMDVARISEVMTASPAEYLASVRKQYESAQAALDAAATVWNADQALYAAGDISRMQYEADKSAYEAAQAALETSRARFEESSRRHAELAAELAAESDGEGSVDERFFAGEEAQLKAQIDAKETILRQLEDQIARCEVHADRNGIIKQIDAKGLSAVNAGTVLCTISDRSDSLLKAEADILTSAAVYLSPGTPVRARLTLRGSETVLSGRVTEVYDYASEDVSALGLEEYRVHVKAELNASEAALEGLPADSGAAAAEPPADSDAAAAVAVSSPSLDGYGAELSFLLYETDALTLPVSAVFQKDHQYFVYVNQDGRAVIQPITVGYSTGSRVVVSGGLAEGDRVIDRINQEGLQEGIRVS